MIVPIYGSLFTAIVLNANGVTRYVMVDSDIVFSVAYTVH